MSGVLAGIFSLVLLTIAILNIKKIKTGDLAISNFQIYLHIGSFAAFTSTYVLLLFALHLKEIKEWTNPDRPSSKEIVFRGHRFRLSIAWICVFFIVVSELPIIHILNSLIAKNIQEKTID